MKSSDIPKEAEMLFDSQDIEFVLEQEPYIFRRFFEKEEITAIAIIVKDGEYTHVWASDSSRPWDINADYVEIKTPKKKEGKKCKS